MQTNLMPDYQNHYYRVAKTFTVFARIGWSESNHYYGSSMICGTVYRRLTLKRGDELHALVGGMFAVLKSGESFEVTLTITEKSPFEKTYYTPPEVWPIERLTEVTRENARRPAQYRREVPKMPAGRIVGRGVHSIVD